MAYVAASIGELDELINNASTLITTAAESFQEMVTLRAMMDIHLHSPIKLVDTLLPKLRVSSQFTIVHVILMAPFASGPSCESYRTSKAALPTNEPLS